MSGWRNPGVLAAIAAAALFGIGTPAAKLLLGPVSPWLLAGLLYLGSGVGLAALRLTSRTSRARLAPGEAKWLAAAIVAGGVTAPVLLMWGLSRMPASTASAWRSRTSTMRAPGATSTVTASPWKALANFSAAKF